MGPDKLGPDGLGPDAFGIVVIGRNEGDRLKVSLAAAVTQSRWVVYVDSGSTDDSVAVAHSLAVDVVELDPQRPFTAARARNAGWQHLFHQQPQVSYIQFVDGDCELIQGWCDRACAVLAVDKAIAVVCGRRRERYPEASVFNQLCDREWNTPIGDADACGGDAMVRVAALQQVRGYTEGLIAGEDPELCLRLRHQGWRIVRIDADMTWHDAAMFHFSQWWQRSMRGGHAYAEVSWRHRHGADPFWRRESGRVWVWGLGLPLFCLGLLLPTRGWSGGLLLAYSAQMVKIYWRDRPVFGSRMALMGAFFYTLVKFPEVQGQIGFHLHQLQGSASQLIEYK